MKQPEDYDDGTGQVCELIKTLHGLKQSGCEWNHKLDSKLKNLGYTRLYLDPCAYICIFTSGDNLMPTMKEEIKASWDVTNMGELKKIIGIKMPYVGNIVTISQQHYIKS